MLLFMRLCLVFCLGTLISSLSPLDQAQAREITDMAGRQVSVPDHIKKVYSLSHPVSFLLYAFAPERLVGLNFPIREQDKPFLPKALIDLPVFGAVMGHGAAMNPEEILGLHPDVLLVWLDRFSDNDKIIQQYGKVGLPIVFVKADGIEDYPETLRFLGQIMDKKERAEQLASYIEDVLKRVEIAVAKVPEGGKRRVYYAESRDGLATDCDRSFHTIAIRLAGGDNIHHCEQSTHGGMEAIGIEDIIARKPELIIAQSRDFALGAPTNPVWREVEAVREGRVYIVPRIPFNWIDRPPSFMQGLGIQWLANLFYPDLYPFDIKAETKNFYRLFLNVDLNDADLTQILQ
ncbi:ABC transporter substrate-binding protein [Beijerinckia indica]|uniref:Periplasmic binding protein n=1 Tax=Beijerinckia indica subsp. indica (strain ATCC 9039 / DSM 1715 / NCIMB 8712) TaxID=395963 RepID=B2IHF4_BEII9|nr:ABC transporter substrate-binding protein [Beijerinckia indica]ACB95939.1 periplasmic binding protein [Beijerinckia indica subsp. indica ATCC 9039]